MNSLIVDFFLGANSEHGFFSHFGQLQDPYSQEKTYIIKAGPGTGKSTMMKRIAEEYNGKDSLIEKIHCSSDPDSLDGVVCKDHQFQIVDGTPPHVMEPKLPAAGEMIISFYEAFHEEEILKHRLEMAQVSAVISGFHSRFCELLRCANLLLDGNSALIAQSVDRNKMERAVQGIIKRELRKKKRGALPGRIKTRLLSAFTPKGLITYEDTINTICNKLYIINDEYNVCGDYFFRMLEQAAIDAGYDCYVCYSPFHPDTQIQHILIPELSLGFVTRNRWIPLEQVKVGKVIHATRFFDKEILKKKKQRLSFCRKTAAVIMEEAVKALEKAKAAHDILEDYYIPNVDFSAVERITEDFYQKIK